MAKSSRRSGGNSVFTGVLLGLIVGAVLAVGVALWVTGVNPFKAASPPPTKPKAPSPAEPVKPEPAPSFEFYKVLPSDRPGEVPAPPAPRAPAPRYYLQAGAFQNPADADNLKAQLAMLGIEAVIQTSDVPNKGVFHRVRVGPFSSMGQVDRTRTLLTQNNIPAALVKEVPTTKETP